MPITRILCLLGVVVMLSLTSRAASPSSVRDALLADPQAALVVSFTLTYFFGYSDNDLETERAVKKVRLGKREPAGV